MSAPTHPPTPCQSCRWCGACGCDRDGLCHEHQFLDSDIAGMKRSRVAYEGQRADPEYAFAEFGTADKPGKIHTLDCYVVRTTIEAAERFLGDPLNNWRAFYPHLLTRVQAEAPGRKRCAQCAPDLREVERKPRPVLSGLGWPLRDSSCARSERPDWMPPRRTSR